MLDARTIKTSSSPSNCNFILLKLLHLDEDALFRRLIRRGLMIRKASSFEGLDNRFVRIAVKNFTNNQRLLATLKEECSVC